MKYGTYTAIFVARYQYQCQNWQRTGLELVYIDNSVKIATNGLISNIAKRKGPAEKDK